MILQTRSTSVGNSFYSRPGLLARRSVPLIGNRGFIVDSVPYQITYDAGDAESGSVPVDSEEYAVGASVTILDNTGSLAKAGFVFAGWTAVEA